jgi:hypothetical protein
MYVVAWLVTSPGLRPASDEPSFLGYAARLLEGGYAVTAPATSYLWHGPGLPTLLAPLVAAGAPLWAMRLLVGPVLLYAAVVAFARVVRVGLPGRPARAYAVALGLYAPVYSVVGTMHKEPLALLLVTVAMGAATVAVRRGSAWACVAAGAALAGLAMTRLEYGWVLFAACAAAVPLALLRRRATSGARRAVALLGVACVLCAPWLGYTHHVTDRPFYWGNSGGLSLYWMSSPAPGQLGEWHAVHTVFRDARLVPYRPLFHRLQRLPPLRRDQALRTLAARQARTHPGKYLENLAANVDRALFAAPFSVPVPPLAQALVVLCNVVLLAMLALAARRAWRQRGRLPPEAPLFAGLAGLGFAIHMLPSSEPRMVIPLVPLVLWCIAATGPRAAGAGG